MHLFCFACLRDRKRRFGVSLSKAIQYIETMTTSTWHKKLLVLSSVGSWVHPEYKQAETKRNW